MDWRAWLHPKKLKQTLDTPKVRKTGIGLVAGWLALVAALFFGGPPLLKSFLVDNLSRQLGRSVSVGAVHVNPFLLSVTVDDFVVAEPDGKTPFFSLKQAYVNAQLASLVARGPVLSEIRVTEPHVRLVRDADGRYNFDDILQRFAKPAQPPPAAPPAKAEPLNFSLNNIQLIRGRIEFDDQPKHRTHEVRDLNVTVPFLSNLFYRVDDYVQPTFSAVVNGAPFRLTGESKPFEADRESSLDLKLSGLELGEYLTYVPKPLHFTLPSGTLDADLKLAFVQPQGKAPVLRITGHAGVQGLELDEAKAVPTLRLKQLDVALGDIEPLAKRFTLERVAASGAELFVRRDRDGRINLANLVEPSESKEPLPYFQVKEIALDQTTVHLRDEQRARPFETSLTDIRLGVRNLTSARGEAGQVQLAASGPDGASLSAATDVVLEPLALSKLSVQLADWALTLPGAKTELLRIGRFGLTGGALDLAQRRMSVDEISLAKSQLNLLRDRQGKLNLSELAGEGGAARTPAPTAGPAWQYAVKQLALDDVGVRWRDEVPAERPADIALDKIEARVADLSSAPGSTAKVTLQAGVARTGHVAVEGGVGLAPLAARLEVNARGVPILPAQPYFADKIHITLTSGSLSARGRVDADFEPKPRIRYRGSLQVNRFASVDHVNRNDFLKWEALHFGGVNLVTEPLSVAINDISLSNFYSRLVINPDGTLNVQHVMGKEPGSKQAVAGEVAAPEAAGEEAAVTGAAAAPATAPATAPAPPQSATVKPAGPPPVPIRIGRVTLQGGQVNFSDHFIQPNYSANLTQIGGSVSGLSSDMATTADVEIRGKVDDTAPVEILGKINPLSGNLFLDLAASAKGVDLPSASPYSTHYAGYPIIKGKLSMDVKYHLENRQLKAENRLILDQLTFGDRVESPSATKLPVLLAVALLKDRNGVIDINLPISGSLDDPKFSLGGIIVRVIVNLVVKAVTAPFALLGHLFGGGEQLAYIEFAPGRASLDQTAEEKIASLTKALADRPGLKLDITGRVDPVADKEGLRQVSLERKVKAVKFEALRREDKAPASLDEVTVDPAEYPKLLKQAYGREKFPKPRNVIGLAKDLPVPEMEKLMLTNTAVTDDDLRSLALRRARVVADAIAKTGQVSPDRVFVLEPKLGPETGTKAGAEQGPAEKAKLSRVDFSLK